MFEDRIWVLSATTVGLSMQKSWTLSECPFWSGLPVGIILVLDRKKTHIFLESRILETSKLSPWDRNFSNANKCWSRTCGSTTWNYIYTWNPIPAFLLRSSCGRSWQGDFRGPPAWRSAAREMWMDQPPPQELRNWDRSDARPYPPGNGYISHQTGSLENHRLKMPFWGDMLVPWRVYMFFKDISWCIFDIFWYVILTSISNVLSYVIAFLFMGNPLHSIPAHMMCFNFKFC